MTCIQSIHPVLAWYNQYLITLSCIQYVWPAKAVFHQFNMYLVDLTDIGAINQGIELHLLYIRYTGTTVYSFDLYLMESFSISWIIPLLDWFDLCWICATCIRLLPPYLDHSNSIWWFQTALLDLNSVWFNQPALVGLPCVWYNWY